MSPINLHGRVVGKTELGMILVAITIEEYLETLPTVDPSGKALAAGETARIPDGMTRGVPFLDAAAQVLRDMPPGKPKRELTPKQKAFGAIGLKHRGTGSKKAPAGDVHTEKACSICGAKFTAKTSRQVTCGSEACKKAHQVKLAAAWLAKNPKGVKASAAPAAATAPTAATAPAPTVKPGALTPAQKEARLAKLKEIKERVYAGKRPGLGATLAATDVPSEFSQAEREAGQE